MQTPIAPSMRFAKRGATLCKLGATLMLTPPLAHHFSINFRRVKLACGRSSQTKDYFVVLRGLIRKTMVAVVQVVPEK
jgi:hypothetical protein